MVLICLLVTHIFGDKKRFFQLVSGICFSHTVEFPPRDNNARSWPVGSSMNQRTGKQGFTRYVVAK